MYRSPTSLAEHSMLLLATVDFSRRLIRRTACVGAVFACLFFCAAAWAQQQKAAQAETPTLKTGAELVLVPALVRDKHGAPVKGLHKEDFEVQENGEAQKIAVFDEVTTSTAAPLKRATIAPGVFSNLVEGGESQTPRVNIIVLDTINTDFADQAWSRQQLIQFLARNIDQHETTALFVLTRGGFK